MNEWLLRCKGKKLDAVGCLYKGRLVRSVRYNSKENISTLTLKEGTWDEKKYRVYPGEIVEL